MKGRDSSIRALWQGVEPLLPLLRETYVTVAVLGTVWEAMTRDGIPLAEIHGVLQPKVDKAAAKIARIFGTSYKKDSAIQLDELRDAVDGLALLARSIGRSVDKPKPDLLQNMTMVSPTGQTEFGLHDWQHWWELFVVESPREFEGYDFASGRRKGGVHLEVPQEILALLHDDGTLAKPVVDELKRQAAAAIPKVKNLSVLGWGRE